MGLLSKRKNRTLFEKQVQHYTAPVLDLCRLAVDSERNPEFPSREFLNRLYGSTLRLQELVDHHGAQHNERWFPFRESIAAAKLFSTVTYILLHIRGSLERYELMSIDADCRQKADSMLATLKGALVRVSRGVLEQASRCDLTPSSEADGLELWHDPDFHYQLEPDRSVRHVEKVGEAVVYLATRFLNLSEDRDVRTVLREHEDVDYSELIPDPISEETMRIVEARFHNLQSLYDTYIFESDVEQQNHDLAFLRGHISIIYHLTEIATHLSHYYIRHMSSLRRESHADLRFPMSQAQLLQMLFECPVHFSRLYLESAVELCRRMIQSYSVHDEIDVPIPNYRGFHVRPSTLIARIVAHYGATVTMTLDGQEYNAGLPLELFRANEQINAVKRRRIGDILSNHPSFQSNVAEDPEERSRELRLLLMELVEQNEIVVYDTDLDLQELDEGSEKTMAELATRVIRHLLSMGKMDIRSDITVRFSGDNRALKDIRILAENGYGEDRMGNNIVLPDELSYLSR